MGYTSSMLFFWAVWLLVPILIDGMTTLTSLVSVLIAHFSKSQPALQFSPFITIIIPVYNSADTLEACLCSIANQTYARSHMEVLLMDNGTTDNSFQIYNQLMTRLHIPMSWHTIIGKGKARALNVGIHLARGRYIFNVDSDAVLAPDAIQRVVETMESNPDLAAVTGSIQVLPPPAEVAPIVQFLGRCEFFEYLTAFHIGRRSQSLLHNMYTLSGAFSVFRHDILMQTTLYSQATVTEDTDITFQIYERFRSYRIGCVNDAIAYVHPIESLSRLYAQRVRWQRGQVEVSARYDSLMRQSIWRPYGFSPARVLLVDHTLAFPRLVWTLLLPILILFGYPSDLIVFSILLLYIFYLVIDLAWTGVALLGARPEARQRLCQDWWILPFLPLYRMGIFWFRLSGFLHAVAEPGTWSVQNPLEQVRAGLLDIHCRLSCCVKDRCTLFQRKKKKRRRRRSAHKPGATSREP